ncbi:CehA/McbA family metallohydrolase [Tepidibacter aestuarii]|uniref:CehA/McbA family metallohydrolase n=1 Tax=Tepidibacter aestuarii TaxID=2925782 RepID=UPI0020BDCEBF|nr:CehA/McbA family metallohydrolase [Tepidibacter aestuarii]CAH2212159.1 putative POLIIIAc domain-containing protein [Tepidibacter aestuarii]
MNKKIIGKINMTKPVPFIHKFSVEGGLNALQFNIDTEHELMFLVWDSRGILRVQHLSGVANKTVVISEKIENSSIGTYPGKIVSGEWKIDVIYYSSKEMNENSDDDLFGEYRITISDNTNLDSSKILNLGEDLWVDYELEDKILTLNKYDWDKLISDQKRWYKGDFHTHTKLSDGSMTNEMAMNQAKLMNLDFLVTTEHNIVSTGWKKGDTVVIPGMEVTTTKGHFNILGIKEYIDVRDKFKGTEIFTQETIDMIMEKSRDMNSLCSVNHCMMNPWHWQFKDTKLDNINTIEICCDPTYNTSSKSNDMAIKLFDILWNDGHKIWGVGGSDSHLLPDEIYENSKDPSLIGDPGTYVFADGLSANSILNSVKNGRVYISRGINLDLKITQDDSVYYPGSKIDCLNKELNDIEINYEVEINNLNDKLNILFIENGKVVDKKEVNKPGKVLFKRLWDKSKYNWARIEIRNDKGEFVSFVNPIYLNEKESKLKTWIDLLNTLEEVNDEN